MYKRQTVSNLKLVFRSSLVLLIFGFCGILPPAQAHAQTLDNYLSKGRQFEASQDYPGAEHLYVEADKAFPHNPEILKRLGIIYQTQIKLPESVEAFKQVLQIDPKYPEVNFYLGLSYFGMNQFDQAIDSFEKQSEVDPKYKRAHYYEAQVYQSIGRKSDALRQYEILLKLDPQDKRVLYQLVRFLKSMTLQAIDQLGNIDPNSTYILVLKAESNAQAQDYTKAIDEYNQVLAKDPNFPGIHFALGENYYNKVDYANAEKELRLALQEDPNNPKANYYLADILVKGER